MRTLFRFLFILLLLPVLGRAQSNTVSFNMADVLGQSATNRTVTIQPYNTPGGLVLDTIITNTGTSGSFTLANLAQSGYLMSVSGNPSVTSLRFSVPSGSGNYDFKTLLTATGNGTNLSYYSQTMANRMFVSQVSGGATLTTNAGGFVSLTASGGGGGGTSNFAQAFVSNYLALLSAPVSNNQAVRLADLNTSSANASNLFSAAIANTSNAIPAVSGFSTNFITNGSGKVDISPTNATFTIASLHLNYATNANYFGVADASSNLAFLSQFTALTNIGARQDAQGADDFGRWTGFVKFDGPNAVGTNFIQKPLIGSNLVCLTSDYTTNSLIAARTNGHFTYIPNDTNSNDAVYCFWNVTGTNAIKRFRINFDTENYTNFIGTIGMIAVDNRYLGGGNTNRLIHAGFSPASRVFTCNLLSNGYYNNPLINSATAADASFGLDFSGLGIGVVGTNHWVEWDMEPSSGNIAVGYDGAWLTTNIPNLNQFFAGALLTNAVIELREFTTNDGARNFVRSAGVSSLPEFPANSTFFPATGIATNLVSVSPYIILFTNGNIVQITNTIPTVLPGITLTNGGSVNATNGAFTNLTVAGVSVVPGFGSYFGVAGTNLGVVTSGTNQTKSLLGALTNLISVSFLTNNASVSAAVNNLKFISKGSLLLNYSTNGWGINEDGTLYPLTYTSIGTATVQVSNVYAGTVTATNGYFTNLTVNGVAVSPGFGSSYAVAGNGITVSTSGTNQTIAVSNVVGGITFSNVNIASNSTFGGNFTGTNSASLIGMSIVATNSATNVTVAKFYAKEGTLTNLAEWGSGPSNYVTISSNGSVSITNTSPSTPQLWIGQSVGSLGSAQGSIEFAGRRVEVGYDGGSEAYFTATKDIQINADSSSVANQATLSTSYILIGGGQLIPAGFIQIKSNLVTTGSIQPTNGLILPANNFTNGGYTVPAMTNGATLFSDGTNLIVVLKSAAGTLTTNKATLLPWP